MSDPTTDNNNEDLRNEDTRIRRAWVDQAMAIARKRLERDLDIPAREPAPRPRLTVVRSGREG